MKLELNKYYETKNGNVVEIIAVGDPICHCLGRIEFRNPMSFRSDGTCASDDAEWDIVSETDRRLRDTGRLRKFNLNEVLSNKSMCFRHNPDTQIIVQTYNRDVLPEYRFVMKYDDKLMIVNEDGWSEQCEIVMKPHSWTPDGIPLYDY